MRARPDLLRRAQLVERDRHQAKGRPRVGNQHPGGQDEGPGEHGESHLQKKRLEKLKRLVKENWVFPKQGQEEVLVREVYSPFRSDSFYYNRALEG